MLFAALDNKSAMFSALDVQSWESQQKTGLS
jgi:hypothetical protein